MKERKDSTALIKPLRSWRVIHEHENIYIPAVDSLTLLRHQRKVSAEVLFLHRPSLEFCSAPLRNIP